MEQRDARSRGSREQLHQHAYAGEAAKTRVDWVHLFASNADARSVEVVRVVNVATDPALREAALDGTLNASDGLLVPYVFHDPTAQKFCLVMPEALRHEALRARAELMAKIAADTRYLVPAYVADVKTVVGSQELFDYLTTSESALLEAHDELASMVAEKEAQLKVLAEKMDLRERRLSARAEEITRREDEVEVMREHFEALARDVSLREQELEARLEHLRDREFALAAREGEYAEIDAEDLAVPSEDLLAQDASDDVEAVDDEDDAQNHGNAHSVSEPPAMVTSAEVYESTENQPEPIDLTAASADEEFSDEEVSDDEVEEDIDDVVSYENTGVGANPLYAAQPPAAPLTPTRTELSGTAVPPPGFLNDPEMEMAAIGGDPLRLFARLDHGREEAFSSQAELLVQFVAVQGYPVALLALVDAAEERPYVRRAALDLRKADHEEILETLSVAFTAEVALYTSDGRFKRAFPIKAAREENAALIWARVKTLGEATIDGATATERALAVPPPLRETHPFSGSIVELNDCRDVLDRIAKLLSWATPERMDRALFALSIPKQNIDGAFRSLGEAALRFGIALPLVIRERVIALGVATDAPDLLAKQVAAFRAVAAADDRGGLSIPEVASNWETLLAEAAEHEFAIDPETHEEAWKILRSVRGDTRVRAGVPIEVDITKLKDMGGPELVILLDHPKARRYAAIELCQRADAAYAGAVFKAVAKMPRADVLKIANHLVAFGEAAGDVFIDGLSAKKAFVRQASLLVLGQLKLRRAVTPIIALLQSEETEVWREAARVLGELGQASYRSLIKAAKERKGNDERFALALAFASLNGSRKAIQTLSKEDSEGLASLAQQASVLEDVAKRASDEIRSTQALGNADSILEFSRKFAEDAKSQPQSRGAPSA